MEEKKVEEEQKGKEESEEEPEEMAETVEEAEVKEETAEVSEKEEAPEKEKEAVEEAVAEGEAVEAKGEEVAAPVEEEEAKPPAREEKAEEEIVEEKIYTVPLGRSWIGPSNRRASRAVRIVRGFVVRHMKFERGGEKESEEEEPKRLVISNEVNERIWGRGIQKPPRKIRIRAAKDKEGNVTVYLAEGD